ncbi:MAG TPA: hypothetical protein VGS57_05810 [Thermoanaerobaculia bacterium]|jgi:hypothetical protein|nr:hypothetical protein [Thermoanaerobaculia bacterium]
MSDEPSPSASLARIHVLLTVQSLVVVLVSINRLSRLTLGYVAPNEFLRWVDLHNMLTLPLISVVAFYLLKKTVESNGRPTSARVHIAVNLAFIAGVYLLGAGYGDHEVTNYLHARFCGRGDASPLCRIVVFNDDDFSHWVFFAGFVLVNATLMLLQALFPRREPMNGRDSALIALNAVLIGAGVFANLAFERIGLDLYVVALLALIAFVLLRRLGRQPLLVYYAIAYGLGLVGTALYKTLR